jgi:hypothetical protein
VESFPKRPGGVEPIDTAGEIVICDNEIGAEAFVRDEVERYIPIWRRHCAITLLFEEKFEEVANLWIVIYDQNRTCAGSVFSDFDTLARSVPFRPRRGIACRDRDLNGKDRALARFGGDTDLMAEKASQALHDRKTEA